MADMNEEKIHRTVHRDWRRLGNSEGKFVEIPSDFSSNKVTPLEIPSIQYELKKWHKLISESQKSNDR